MRTNRKVSLTIDEEIYAAIDQASKTLNLAKSQLAQEAFSLWLKKQTEALMAKGYERNGWKSASADSFSCVLNAPIT